MREASPVAASPAAAATVAIRQHPSLGQILTDPAGRTLYRFTRDTPGTSSCYDQCAAAWPPLLAQGQPTAPPGLSGRLSLTARTDGTQQVTYNDTPLHYFGGDAQPGDTNGQGVGNLWFVVNPG